MHASAICRCSMPRPLVNFEVAWRTAAASACSMRLAGRRRSACRASYGRASRDGRTKRRTELPSMVGIGSIPSSLLAARCSARLATVACWPRKARSSVWGQSARPRESEITASTPMKLPRSFCCTRWWKRLPSLPSRTAWAKCGWLLSSCRFGVRSRRSNRASRVWCWNKCAGLSRSDCPLRWFPACGGPSNRCRATRPATWTQCGCRPSLARAARRPTPMSRRVMMWKSDWRRSGPICWAWKGWV